LITTTLKNLVHKLYRPLSGETLHREKHATLDLLSINNAPGHPAYLDDYNLNVKCHNNPPGYRSGFTANLKAYYLRRTSVHATEENSQWPNFVQVSDILQQSHPQHCYKHGKKLAKLV
jgi:hypothetical protein